ncbi:hypothetical protein P7K49_002610 [Saguinus oedipus]|uniref:Uncharacterized protein n=1 Tax=Saguinus oedipus TaxID=9490 RepID=A0ABQ9WJV5_SAGOE|nr:hypothetical protein P7K49_002610 [Saguinus oedipus]
MATLSQGRCPLHELPALCTQWEEVARPGPRRRPRLYLLLPLPDSSREDTPLPGVANPPSRASRRSFRTCHNTCSRRLPSTGPREEGAEGSAPCLLPLCLVCESWPRMLRPASFMGPREEAVKEAWRGLREAAAPVCGKSASRCGPSRGRGRSRPRPPICSTEQPAGPAPSTGLRRKVRNEFQCLLGTRRRHLCSVEPYVWGGVSVQAATWAARSHPRSAVRLPSGAPPWS